MNKKLLIIKNKNSEIESTRVFKEFKNDLRMLINVIIKYIPTNELCISLSMTLKDCTNSIKKDLKRKLTLSNSTIPRIYCLPG